MHKKVVSNVVMVRGECTISELSFSLALSGFYPNSLALLAMVSVLNAGGVVRYTRPVPPVETKREGYQNVFTFSPEFEGDHLEYIYGLYPPQGYGPARQVSPGVYTQSASCD